MKKIIFITTALLASVITLSAQKLVIKGSDTLGAKLVPMLAEEYRAKNPHVSFEIAAEGSSTGITAISSGTADIGMSSRKAKSIELSAAAAKGILMKPTIVAFDGMAVIVHQDNTLKELTRKQIEQIFTGEITDWSALGGNPGTISVYTRNTSSGTYSDWKELAMKKKDYASSSQKLAGSEQIVSEVSKNTNGIGYVGLAYISEPGIHVVKVDGHLPTKAEVLSKSYPYARPTYYYTNGEPTGEAAKFVTFTLSPEGQSIVEKVGFISAVMEK
jgi:phosphate transport system substrate-binding protein